MIERRNRLASAGQEQVRPLPGSMIDRKMRKNAEWLFSLDPERLLAEPRDNGGIDTKGVQRYGGWGK